MKRDVALSGEAWEFAEEPDFTRAPRDDEAARERPELDAVRLYFQQIARVPLLKPREERALCERIESAHHAVAAALLAVPAAARRIADLSAAVRTGVSVPNGLLELRYGIVNAHEHTLQDIAERLGVSREQVRQIEKHAMQRLQRRRGQFGAPPAAA